MNLPLFLFTLKSSRGSIIAWSFFLFLYALLMVYLFNQMHDIADTLEDYVENAGSFIEVFAGEIGSILNPDGTLVPRSQPGAIIQNLEDVVARSLRIITEGKAIAVNGEEIHIRADTICLHGDTLGAVALARGLRQRMEAVGIAVVPMSDFL